MPAGTTALTTLAPPATPAGPTWDEQNSDEVNGNNFDNGGGDTMLYVRNTTAGALVLDFFADVFGTELTVLSETIPGSGTDNGVRVLGPFPDELFNDHSATEAASNGLVMILQATGAAGNLVFTPFKLNRSLLG